MNETREQLSETREKLSKTSEQSNRINNTLSETQKQFNETREQLNRTNSTLSKYLNSLLSDNWNNFKLFTDSDGKHSRSVLYRQSCIHYDMTYKSFDFSFNFN